MKNKFKNKLMHRIASILEEHINARDSDERVVWHYIARYYGDPSQLSAQDLLTAMHLRHIPRFESISRARRKVQEEQEELRGETYSGRKKKAVEMKNIFRGN